MEDVHILIHQFHSKNGCTRPLLSSFLVIQLWPGTVSLTTFFTCSTGFCDKFEMKNQQQPGSGMFGPPHIHLHLHIWDLPSWLSHQKMGIYPLLYVHIGDYSITFDVFLVISSEPISRSES